MSSSDKRKKTNKQNKNKEQKQKKKSRKKLERRHLGLNARLWLASASVKPLRHRGDIVMLKVDVRIETCVSV